MIFFKMSFISVLQKPYIAAFNFTFDRTFSFFVCNMSFLMFWPIAIIFGWIWASTTEFWKIFKVFGHVMTLKFFQWIKSKKTNRTFEWFLMGNVLKSWMWSFSFFRTTTTTYASLSWRVLSKLGASLEEKAIFCRWWTSASY